MHAAYLAGIIDGQGSVVIKSQKRGKAHQPTVQISFHHRETLERIKTEYGGVIRKEKPSPPYFGERYRWVAIHKAAYRVAEDCLPYLIHQREKAIEIIAHGKAAVRGRPRKD